MSRNNRHRYSNTVKDASRNTVLGALTAGRDMTRQTVLFMPSGIGAEIDILRGMGVPDSSMLMVDYSSANLAKVTKAFQVQGARSYALSIRQAADAIGADLKGKRIDIADFDLCTNVNAKKMFAELWPYLDRRLLAKNATVRVTFFRGHETGQSTYALASAVGRENAIKAFFATNGYAVTSYDQGCYQNGKAPMGWIVLRLRELPVSTMRYMPDFRGAKMASLDGLVAGLPAGKKAALTKLVKKYIANPNELKPISVRNFVTEAEKAKFLAGLKKGYTLSKAAGKARPFQDPKRAASAFFAVRYREPEFDKAWAAAQA